MAKRRADFTEWMRPYDALLTADHGRAGDPARRSRRDLADPGLSHAAGNYLGLCSLAMPRGFSGGLPVGIQIVGKPYAERDVLQARQGLPGRDRLPPPRARPQELGL